MIEQPKFTKRELDWIARECAGKLVAYYQYDAMGKLGPAEQRMFKFYQKLWDKVAR